MKNWNIWWLCEFLWELGWQRQVTDFGLAKFVIGTKLRVVSCFSIVKSCGCSHPSFGLGESISAYHSGYAYTTCGTPEYFAPEMAGIPRHLGPTLSNSNPQHFDFPPKQPSSDWRSTLWISRLCTWGIQLRSCPQNQLQWSFRSFKTWLWIFLESIAAISIEILLLWSSPK